MKKIILAFEGGERWGLAFTFALRLAATFNAELLIVKVTPLADYEKLLDSGADDGCEELRCFCDQAKGEGVSCRYRISVGRFANQLLKAAEDHHCDLIVVAGAGLRETTEQATEAEVLEILREARCPVTVVNKS